MIVLKRDEKEVVEVERKGRWKKEDSKDAPKEAEEAPPAPGEEDSMETSSTPSSPPAPYSCTGLTTDQAITLLRAAVGLISIPAEPDILNAILRLCLRLTRQSTLFAELGDLRLLLGLTQLSAFSFLASLLQLTTALEQLTTDTTGSGREVAKEQTEGLEEIIRG